MKRLNTFFAFILLSTIVMAQQDKLQETLAADTILYQIYHHLPTGWTMSMDDTSIMVFRVEKYALIESDCSSISPDSLALYPRNETAKLIFRYEPLWEQERMFWSKETNDSIKMVLNSLPQEMGISHLYDAKLSTKGNKIYSGKTKSEKEKVASYYKRRGELLSNLYVLPSFNTNTFSLFQRYRNCIGQIGYCIVPNEAQNESRKVFRLFLEYCKNN